MRVADLSIVVVGGGIGGLTCACALADRGAHVQVLEQAPAFGDVGAGIQITPNGGRVLHALGLGARLAQISVGSDAVVPYDGLSGRPLARFDLTDQAPRYRFVHRAKLIDLLVAGCTDRGVTLRTGVRVLSANSDGQVTCDAPQGRTAARTETYDLVVFADGFHSIGRSCVNGPSKAVFTQQVAWRAIIEGQMPQEARIAMGPRRHLVTYPIDANHVNIVAVQEREDWANEGWTQRDSPQNIRAAFQDFAPEFKVLLDKVEAVHLWGLFRHGVAARWSKGAMMLLGDAAHPTLPFLAQGANLAIEDAYVLARSLAEQRNLQSAGKRYRQLRYDRVVRAIAAANANTSNYHLSGLRRAAALAGLRAIGTIAPNAFLNRLSWLYDHDVTL